MVGVGEAMEAYTKSLTGPFASGGNFSGGFLPVVDFLSADGKKNCKDFSVSDR
jgi:hypothetical protein